MTNENKKKRYYWIKLKDGFFDTDEIDFLLSQKNGADYVVLYQMLCAKTVHTNGRLAKNVGELFIQYDAAKIQRECKYFSIDTILVALNLFKKLGLIYKEEDGTMQISNYEDMLGSETQGSLEKQMQRDRQRDRQKIDTGIDKLENVQQNSNQMSNKIPTNTESYLNKNNKPISNYEESKSNNIQELLSNFNSNLLSRRYLLNNYNSNLVTLSKGGVCRKETTGAWARAHTHEKPTLTDVTEYVKSQGLQVNAKRFFNYYESVGWKINGEPIRDWRARLRLWDSEDKGGNNGRYGEINDL